MKAIVAVDLNWGIGCDGELLERIPGDMKFFREMTLGKVVVMGRETFESLPGRSPLKDRVNIILTRNREYAMDPEYLINSDDIKKSDHSTSSENFTSHQNAIFPSANFGKAILCHCVDELMTILGDYAADDVFVIGGEAVYTLLLPYCRQALVTKIFNSYAADRHFPDLDRLEGWKLVEEGERLTHKSVEYCFAKYINQNFQNLKS